MKNQFPLFIVRDYLYQVHQIIMPILEQLFFLSECKLFIGNNVTSIYSIVCCTVILFLLIQIVNKKKMYHS